MLEIVLKHTQRKTYVKITNVNLHRRQAKEGFGESRQV